MVKGQRLKPERIFTLMRQIDVLTTNGKTLAQTPTESTHVAAMIHHRKILFGSGPKLTAVHLNLIFARVLIKPKSTPYVGSKAHLW